MAILSAIPLVFWIILWCYWLVSAFRAKKSVHTPRWWLVAFGTRFVMLVIVIFAIYVGHGGFLKSFSISSFGQPAAPTPTNILLGVIGDVLCAGGVTFAIWARAYLGKNWGMPMTLREKPDLVTSGPYKFVRHPIYGGFFIGMFGTGLADGGIWFLILFFAGIYFIYSAKIEDKMMLKEFPDQYPAYKNKTKMFIPFLL